MKKKIFASIITLAAFIAEIVLLRRYDVAAIGPNGTSIGFSHINKAVHDATGVNMLWYDITDYIGYAAIAIVLLFALAGFIQLIKRRSLFKVDREIICLGCLFAAVMVCYVLFEKIVINYRPVIMEGETAPEASFPSSHTMLVMTVMIAVSLIIGRYIDNGPLRGIIRAICTALAVITVGGRLHSGVHWLTDIIGGVLLSCALLFAFSAGIGSGSGKTKSLQSDPGSRPKISERDRVINGYRTKH